MVSLKELSRANSQGDRVKIGKILETSDGSSGKTFRCLMKLLDASQPRTLLLENVDAIDDSEKEKAPDDGELEFLYKSLFAAGYAAAHSTFVASHHGLPQRRSRIYIVGVRFRRFGITAKHAQDIANNILEAASRMACPLVRLEKFLLPDQHPTIKAELEQQLANKSSQDKERTGKGICTPSYLDKVSRMCGLPFVVFD